MQYSGKATKEEARFAMPLAERAQHCVSIQENTCFYGENPL